MTDESTKEEPPAGGAEKAKKISWDLKLARAAHNAKYHKANPGPLYSWPMGLWFTIFFVVPLFIIVLYSFMKRDVYGGVVHEFTLKAYRQMFDKAYGMIFLRTLWITFISTAITILIALPCGYAMARSKHQTLLLILVVIPSIVFFFLEYHNTMEGMDLTTRLLASLFQSVTCRTAGFNTIDQFALKDASKLLSILLMFIGGAPAGTAGGIKLTTVAVIFLSAKGLLAGKDRAQAFERWISKTTVIKACSIFFIATYALLFGIFLVSVFENGAMGFLNEAYELTSAIATVGLSVGISGSCSLASRAVICLLMFMGRVGILTIALAVGGKKEKPYLRYPEADIMVG